MTRKEAINYAIRTIIDANGDNEAVQLLRDIQEEMPIHHWSKKSILDACTQWVQDHGFMPTAQRLDQISYLPSHTALKTHFNMTYAEFLNKYFARPNEHYIPQYGSKPTGEWLKLFREEYQRIKPTSQLEFDLQRGEGTPCCMTFVRRFSPDAKYSTLTAMLGLPKYERKKKEKTHERTEFTVHVVIPEQMGKE